MEDDRSADPGRVRLPGFDEPAGHRRPAYGWYRDEYGPPPPGYWQAGYARDGGLRTSRRASSWTAAALIAGVAATTGYLAHAIPTTGAATKTTGAVKHKSKHHARKTTVQAPSAPAPAYQAPVVTSGGSGAAGAAGGGGGD